MRNLGAALFLLWLGGCATQKPASRHLARGGSRVPGLSGASPRSASPLTPPLRGRASLSGLEPLDLPSQESAASQAGGGAQAMARGAGSASTAEPQASEPTPGQSALPLESGGKPVNGGQPGVSPPGAGAQPPSGREVAAGAGGAAADAGDAGAPAGAGDAAAPDASAGAAQEAAPPPMAGVNKDSINKLLDNRLDIGGYRVQIAANDDFADGQVLFDKTYDVMENINLFDEFKAAGVNIDQNAYWVRIAFIDLLQIELPWTKPRLYGLNKKRLSSE